MVATDAYAYLSMPHCSDLFMHGARRFTQSEHESGSTDCRRAPMACFCLPAKLSIMDASNFGHLRPIAEPTHHHLVAKLNSSYQQLRIIPRFQHRASDLHLGGSATRPGALKHMPQAPLRIQDLQTAGFLSHASKFCTFTNTIHRDHGVHFQRRGFVCTCRCPL